MMKHQRQAHLTFCSNSHAFFFLDPVLFTGISVNTARHFHCDILSPAWQDPRSSCVESYLTATLIFQLGSD